MLTCSLSVRLLCVCVSSAAVCVFVCVSRYSSPHPILGCNLCHWLEFDGWVAPHNTVSQGWSGSVRVRVCKWVHTRSSSKSLCLTPSQDVAVWSYYHACVLLRVCAWTAWCSLSLHRPHRRSITVRSPEETAEAAAVRGSQLPLVTLVGSNLEGINSEP